MGTGSVAGSDIETTTMTTGTMVMGPPTATDQASVSDSGADISAVVIAGK